jgi:hypothetical protein
MKRLVRLPVRATPPSERYPHGVPREIVETEYDEREFDFVRRLMGGLDGPDPEAAANEVAFFHECMSVLDARLLSAAEEAELGLLPEHAPAPKKEPVEGPIQTTLLPPEGTSTVFKIPEKARRQLGWDAVPDFDGATINQERDKPRLFPQLQRVGEAMKDGRWRTLEQIASATGDPQASISARLRDFRKVKFGAHEVERRYVSDGLHEYRLILNQSSAMPLGYGDPSVADDEEEVAVA